MVIRFLSTRSFYDLWLLWNFHKVSVYYLLWNLYKLSVSYFLWNFHKLSVFYFLGNFHKLSVSYFLWNLYKLSVLYFLWNFPGGSSDKCCRQEQRWNHRLWRICQHHAWIVNIGQVRLDSPSSWLGHIGQSILDWSYLIRSWQTLSNGQCTLNSEDWPVHIVDP